MPVDNAEWFGRIMAGLALLFAGIFFGLLTASGQGIDVYTSSADAYSQNFPPWNISGSSFNGTDYTNGDLIINESSSGSYTFTSPILEEDALIQISDFEYSAEIGTDQAITVKVYTSNDQFKTIQNSESFSLDDGVGERVVDLPREQDYRVQAIMTYSGTGQEPALETLRLSGSTFSRDYDFTVIFTTLAFWILLIAALFVVLPRR